MENIKIVSYVKECVQELAERYKNKDDFFSYESDIHADLYVILNKKNPLFWEKGSMVMGSESNFKGYDLVIHDPDTDKEEIFIEIKYIERIEKIELDLIKLSKCNGVGIMIYFEGKKYDYNTIKDKLRQLSVKYPSVEIIYYHPKKDSIETIKSKE